MVQFIVSQVSDNKTRVSLIGDNELVKRYFIEMGWVAGGKPRGSSFIKRKNKPPTIAELWAKGVPHNLYPASHRLNELAESLAKYDQQPTDQLNKCIATLRRTAETGLGVWKKTAGTNTDSLSGNSRRRDELPPAVREQSYLNARERTPATNNSDALIRQPEPSQQSRTRETSSNHQTPRLDEREAPGRDVGPATGSTTCNASIGRPRSPVPSEDALSPGMSTSEPAASKAEGRTGPNPAFGGGDAATTEEAARRSVPPTPNPSQAGVGMPERREGESNQGNVLKAPPADRSVTPPQTTTAPVATPAEPTPPSTPPAAMTAPVETKPDEAVKRKTMLAPLINHIPEAPTIEAFPPNEHEIESFGNQILEPLQATRRTSATRQDARVWGDALGTAQLVALPEGGKQLRSPALRPRGAANPLIRGFASGSEPNLIYLVGDIHGDLLALEAAIQCIQYDSKVTSAQAESPNKRSIILLGDLIDDGPESHLVLNRVNTWAREHPGEIILIPGNHDLALQALDDGTFSAQVSPCQFADWLNDPAGDVTDADRVVARQFVEYCQQHGPAAVVLPDRTLAVHGGVPHAGLWNLLANWHAGNPEPDGVTEDELALRVLNDFSWGRIHSRAKHKFPDPASQSQEIGTEDVKKSLRILGDLLGGDPPIRVIRGHDHKEERYEIPKKHENRVITINTMSYRQGREHLGPPTREPVIARWRKHAGGQTPTLTLLQIKLRPDFVAEHAPELRARESESNAK